MDIFKYLLAFNVNSTIKFDSKGFGFECYFNFHCGSQQSKELRN